MDIMKILFRIIISGVFAVSGMAVFALCATLITPTVNWIQLISLALVGVGLLFIAWQVAVGATWRDVMDFITDAFSR
jgi:hypothetical protein